MKVFDTDIVSDYFRGFESVVVRVSRLSPSEVFLPIVGVEELLRGRLDVVRQAQADRATIPIDEAYDWLRSTVRDVNSIAILAYTNEAQQLFLSWRTAKIRVGSQDLRIAAISVANDATLVTRNRRDFQLVPGLKLEVW